MVNHGKCPWGARSTRLRRRRASAAWAAAAAEICLPRLLVRPLQPLPHRYPVPVALVTVQFTCLYILLPDNVALGVGCKDGARRRWVVNCQRPEGAWLPFSDSVRGDNFRFPLSRRGDVAENRGQEEEEEEEEGSTACLRHFGAPARCETAHPINCGANAFGGPPPIGSLLAQGAAALAAPPPPPTHPPPAHALWVRRDNRQSEEETAQSHFLRASMERESRLEAMAGGSADNRHKRCSLFPCAELERQRPDGSSMQCAGTCCQHVASGCIAELARMAIRWRS